MSLDSIIAQRIGAASQARERLYNPAAIGSALGQYANHAMVQQTQDAQTAEENAGVPAPVAGLVAENLVPHDAPDRTARVGALVSSLGATGGAKLLAKLAAYTALFNKNNSDALGRLKLSADMADGTYGRPPAAPRVVGGGGGGGGGGGRAPAPVGPDVSGDIDLINGADNLDDFLKIDLPNMGDPRVRGAYNAKIKVLGAKGVAGRAAGANEDRDRDFEYRKTRDLKLDYDKQEARRNGDFAKWGSIVGEQIRNIDKEINRLEVYETDFNGKVTRKIVGSTEYYNKLLQDRQDKVKELEAVKGEFSAPPPVPGASPPVGGRYQWIGGESGTEIVMTTTPNAPPGFKPYTPGGGAGTATQQIARIGEKGVTRNFLYDASKEEDFDPSIPAYNPATGMIYRNWNGKGQYSHDNVYRASQDTGGPNTINQVQMTDSAAEALKAALRKALGK